MGKIKNTVQFYCTIRTYSGLVWSPSCVTNKPYTDTDTDTDTDTGTDTDNPTYSQSSLFLLDLHVNIQYFFQKLKISLANR